ncbi:MAG: DUF2384 domain-containing protein [Rhodocyclaceae bacterium]|nr:DUF2384 domain-containing protein [Rhodocyclaceae bacterium]
MTQPTADQAVVIQLAEEVFGGAERAQAWLRTENTALDGQTPASLLDTEAGRLEVTRILHAIARGMSA